MAAHCRAAPDLHDPRSVVTVVTDSARSCLSRDCNLELPQRKALFHAPLRLSALVSFVLSSFFHPSCLFYTSLFIFYPACSPAWRCCAPLRAGVLAQSADLVSSSRAPEQRLLQLTSFSVPRTAAQQLEHQGPGVERTGEETVHVPRIVVSLRTPVQLATSFLDGG